MTDPTDLRKWASVLAIVFKRLEQVQKPVKINQAAFHYLLNRDVETEEIRLQAVIKVINTK